MQISEETLLNQLLNNEFSLVLLVRSSNHARNAQSCTDAIGLLKGVFLAQKTIITTYKTTQQIKLLESRPTKMN